MTCPAVKEECPLTSWKLTASSLACLKAVASWSALLSFLCFVQCPLQTSDLRDSAVHGSDPSPLLSMNVTWIWGGSSAFRKKAWTPAAPFSRAGAPLFVISTRLADHSVLSLFLEDDHITNNPNRVQGIVCNHLELMKYQRIMPLRCGHMVFLRYVMIPARCLIPPFR